MGNCASWCAGEDDSYATAVRQTNQQFSPSYVNKQPGPRGPTETDEEIKRKVREAAEKRYAQDKSHHGAASGVLRYQQERQQKIDEAEDRVTRSGGAGQTPLRWQQD